jgi:hypothetical protein
MLDVTHVDQDGYVAVNILLSVWEIFLVSYATGWRA